MVQSPYENRLHLHRRVFAGGQASIVSVKGRARDKRRNDESGRPWSVKKAAIRITLHLGCGYDMMESMLGAVSLLTLGRSTADSRCL